MTDERIIAYLLGELPEDDLERFEGEGFDQDDWQKQINLVELDLIDAYVRNKLTPERRQRFKQNYLTTEVRLERVIMATALLRHIDKLSPEPTWVERFKAFWGGAPRSLRAASAVAVVAVIASAWWMSRTPSPRTFATLTLNITYSTRGEGVKAGNVKLTPDDEALKISLLLPEQPPQAASYRVEVDKIESDDGEALSAEVAGQDARSVQVVIPASQLAPGQYVLKLFAIKPDNTEQRIEGAYHFAVK